MTRIISTARQGVRIWRSAGNQVRTLPPGGMENLRYVSQGMGSQSASLEAARFRSRTRGATGI